MQQLNNNWKKIIAFYQNSLYFYPAYTVICYRVNYGNTIKKFRSNFHKSFPPSGSPIVQFLSEDSNSIDIRSHFAYKVNPSYYS